MNIKKLTKKLSLLIAPIVLGVVLSLSASAAEISSGKPVVLEFTSPMCSACNQIKQNLPEIETKYSSRVDIKKYNAASGDSETQQLMTKYNVKVVPTLIYINKDGKVIRTSTGALTTKQLDKYFSELGGN